jgi:hypothetical protein
MSETGSDMLAASSGSTRALRETSRLNGPLAVVDSPSLEQLYDPATVRIVGLNGIDPLDRIATAEGQEWIAAPFAPFFEAAA